MIFEPCDGFLTSIHNSSWYNPFDSCQVLVFLFTFTIGYPYPFLVKAISSLRDTVT